MIQFACLCVCININIYIHMQYVYPLTEKIRKAIYISYMKVKDFHIKVCISFVYIMNIFYFKCYFIFCQKFIFLVGSYMNFNTWINSRNHHYKNILQRAFIKNYFYNAKKKVTINPGKVLGFSRPLPRKPPATEASSRSPISSSCSSTSSPQAWKQLTWHTKKQLCGRKMTGKAHSFDIFIRQS